MRKLLTFLLVALLLSNSSYAFAVITPVETKTYWRAQMYIANSIRGIGLIDSYFDDWTDISYVYDNSLAAMASMSMGNFALAKEILDTLALEVKRNEFNVLYERYYYYDYEGYGQGLAYAGNTAWLLQAMNVYQKLRGSKTYYNIQKQLADHLLSLQDANDGAIRGSAYDYWKSTEHNIMAYVALRNFGRLNNLTTYVTQAEKIKTLLTGSSVWNGSYFNRGPWDYTRVTDVQALGVMLLGSTYSAALTWAEQNLKLSKDFYGKTVTGFDFNDDLDTIWTEGNLQMATAFYKAGNASKANYYNNEASKIIQANGSLLLATNSGTATDTWILEPWESIAPTSWLVMFYNKFNPCILY